MSGMVLTGHGGLDRLEWRTDLPIPVPSDGEVLIRVGASALNNTDVNTRVGWYSKTVRAETGAGAASFSDAETDDGAGWDGGAIPFPLIQGADCCGEIVGVGPGVAETRIGERVLMRALQSRQLPDGSKKTYTPGTDFNGAFAEFMTVRADDAVQVNSSLSDVELASFPCAFSTAEAMIQRAGLSEERVLVTGASGGVGAAAVQLAKRRGAHVTAQTTTDKEQAVRAIGADDILFRGSDLPQQAFDVVLDVVGGARWPALSETLSPDGRYVTSGAIAGPIVELDLRTLYLRDLSLLGSTFQPANVFLDLVRYIEAGEIQPHLAATYPLKDLRAAQEVFLAKTHVGKIGITVRM